MNLLRPAVAALLAVALAACGFQLRREAHLPAAMQRVHIEIDDASSALARDLGRALQRSGAELVAHGGAGVATFKVYSHAYATDVLSVGGNARATEYTLRYRVEFGVTDPAGGELLARQALELTRDFTFDASQALGIAAETDLLRQELERDMVATVLRRLQVIARATP
ncbi:MAG: hypothetical protein IT477_09260 [Rhodanobacteraceae bacterium]|nr:hypothetical protein [Rhodanobacteraceae bacterium]